MPLDFRYHLVSVIAVFCALLIGVLFGIALVGDPNLERQVERYVGYIRTQEQDIERLQAQARAYQTFGREVLPQLIGGKLPGRRIAIVENHDFRHDPLGEQLAPLLTSAGARVTSTTTVLRPFVKLTAEGAAPVLEELGYPMPVDRNVRSLLAAKMAVHISLGKPELVQRLRAMRLINVSGDYNTPADCVLIAGGLNEGDLGGVEAIDLPMIRALQEQGVQVVACESSTAQESSVRFYQPRNIPTVDNADTAPGQLALVLAICGQEGNYGIKPGADHLLPPRAQW